MRVLVVVDGSAVGAHAVRCSVRRLVADTTAPASVTGQDLRVLDLTPDGDGLVGAEPEILEALQQHDMSLHHVVAPATTAGARSATYQDQLDAGPTDVVVVGMDHRAATLFGGASHTWEAIRRAAERGVSIALVTRPLTERP